MFSFRVVTGASFAYTNQVSLVVVSGPVHGTGAKLAEVISDSITLEISDGDGSVELVCAAMSNGVMPS